MRKWKKVLVWLAYVGIAGWWGFGWRGWEFLVGNIIALGLGLVDRLLYVWWLYPFEQSSIQVQYWTRRRDLKAVIGLLLGGTANQHKLIFRSLGFAFVWVMLAVYVMSSTGSIVAMGMVMGLGFDLVWSILNDWKLPGKLGTWLCWQIKRPVTEREVRWYAGTFVAIWGIFLLQLMWGR